MPFGFGTDAFDDERSRKTQPHHTKHEYDRHLRADKPIENGEQTQQRQKRDER